MPGVLSVPCTRVSFLQTPFVERPPTEHSASSGTGGADGGGKPALFMFMAVFSTTDFRHRRDAVREAWMEDARRSANVVAKFILTGALDCIVFAFFCVPKEQGEG